MEEGNVGKSELYQTFSKTDFEHKDDLASLISKSLQDIIISKEFEDAPNIIKRQIKHLSFLLHLLLRYQDFLLVHKYHLDVIKDIKTEKTSWSDDLYFTQKEENIESEVLDTKNEIKSRDKIEPYDTNDGGYHEEWDNNLSCNDTTVKDKTIIVRKSREIKKKKKQKLKKPKIEPSESDFEDSKNKVFCLDCNEYISGNLTCHKNRVHKTKHNCPFCSNQVISEKVLLKHIQKHHKDEQSELLCSNCGDVSLDIGSYINHLGTHKLTSHSVECPICQKEFKDKNKVQNHIKAYHEQEDEPKKVCPFCGNSYKKLEAHIYFQHSKKELIVCTLCDYSNQHQSQIDAHIRRVHKLTGVTCQVCGKLVKDLKRHALRGCITSVVEKKFECNICKKKVGSKLKLKRHVDGIHLNIRDKQCPLCSYRTNQDFNLKMHITRIHEGKALKSQCQFCNKQVYSLDWHTKMYHAPQMIQEL